MQIDAPDHAAGSPAPAGPTQPADRARRLIEVPGVLTPLSEGAARLLVHPVTSLAQLDVLTATLRTFRQIESVAVDAVNGETVHLLVGLREPLSLAGQLRTRLGEAVVAVRPAADHLIVELDPSRSWLVEPPPGDAPAESAAASAAAPRRPATADRRRPAPPTEDEVRGTAAMAARTAPSRRPERASRPPQPASRTAGSPRPRGAASGRAGGPGPNLPPRMAPASVPAPGAQQSRASDRGRHDLAADVLARNVLDAIPDTSVLVLDAAMTFRAVAGTALTRHGSPREALLGRTAREALPTLPWDELEPACRSALRGDASGHEFETLDHAAVFEATVSPVRDAASGTGAVLVLRDVTSRRRDAAVIADADEMFQLSFVQAPIGKAIVAPDGRFLKVNEALCRLLGHSESELLTRDFREITHPDDLDTDEALVQETLDGVREGYVLEKRYLHADGREINAQLSVAVVREAGGRPRWLVAQVVDTTRSRKLEEELRAGAERDTLTGLWNRSRLGVELELRAQEARRYGVGASLLSIDLDGFAKIDRALGRARGDAFLRTVAGALRSSVRDCDHCARVDGDEFVVLLPHTPAAGAAIVAARIGEALRGCDAPGLAPGSLRASIGVAELVPGMTADRWVRHAEDARRTAARAGGGRAIVAEGSSAAPALAAGTSA